MRLSREEIRAVACPHCNAKVGSPCVHEGKGSLRKNRRGMSHYQRMSAAQTHFNVVGRDDDFDLIDDGDDEAAFEAQQRRLQETGGPDDSAYRRAMIDAGRRHLLPR